MAENVFIRPGTLFIVIIAALIGLSVLSWSENLLQSTDESSDQGSRAIECSTLDINFVDEETNGTHHTVFIQLNKDVDALAVTFEGNDDNTTRIVENPGSGSVSEVTVQVSNVSDIRADVKSCSRVFRR